MKRNMIVKCLLFAVVAFVAVFARADMPRPTWPTYHALSRSEWEVRQGEFKKHESTLVGRKIVETIQEITCGNAVTVLLASCVLSLLGVTVCMVFFPQTKLVFVFILALILGGLGFMLVWFDIGAMAVADGSVSELDRSQKECNITAVRDDIPVDPKPGETYEEYKSRVYEYNNPTYRCGRCGGETHYLITGEICGKCAKEERENMR